MRKVPYLHDYLGPMINDYQAPPNPNENREVLGLVELIDAKGIDMAQPIWP